MLNNPNLPCTKCGLTTTYGECPSLKEIGLSAATAVYEELAKINPSKINVWYISSDEAYYKGGSGDRYSRMVSIQSEESVHRVMEHCS